ncbi:response regulator transcription factor [Amycolatopsis sp. CA-230715]|uniref:response regulator transcription factor n=1 Tax=Amycolatopsis sp. CA-230715 TaxID=2745196 RepID=UPI001C038FAE|nr:response regulator transcription factor [Amycolatopsis sp. CA-230715]QWF84884.1 hypothetical protein HUW46_08336 [Amycolatopsis sp. CA-230715]
MTLTCLPPNTAESEAATVMVAVHASDPMTGLGAASILGVDRRLNVLTGADLSLAEVIVVVEDSIDNDVFAFLRDVRAKTRLPSPPRCVIVTDHFRTDAVITAIECGMAALLRRSDTTSAELVRTVLAVSKGLAYLPPRVQGSLLQQLDRIREDVLEPNGLTLSGLSARERDVLRLLADGRGTEEIAAALAYSESTVKNVLHGLMSRFGLHSRSHAVAYALRSGVI